MEKNLSFLQVLLLLIVLISLCGGEKQNQTFDCTEEKKKSKERKRVPSVGDTHLNDSTGYKVLNRAAANLLLGEGKPSRCSSTGDRSTTKG